MMFDFGRKSPQERLLEHNARQAKMRLAWTLRWHLGCGFVIFAVLAGVLGFVLALRDGYAAATPAPPPPAPSMDGWAVWNQIRPYMLWGGPGVFLVGFVMWLTPWFRKQGKEVAGLGAGAVLMAAFGAQLWSWAQSNGPGIVMGLIQWVSQHHA